MVSVSHRERTVVDVVGIGIVAVVVDVEFSGPHVVAESAACPKDKRSANRITSVQKTYQPLH